MDHRGKVVVVTGASSGIGYDAAREFARRGSTIVGVARREELLKRLVTECRSCSPNSSHLCGDLGERSFAERVVEDTVTRHARIDVLVNNAGIPSHNQTEIWEKDETPSGYTGRKHPPSIVTAAIFEAIEQQRHEIIVPKHSPQLVVARLLR
jgi:short-subunit dehydrogenase